MPKLASIIMPATAGPITPETPHCMPINALVRPRKCSGESSLARAGDVGDQTISPNAKTIWLIESKIPATKSGASGATPTKIQESAQIKETETNARCFEMRVSNFKTSGCRTKIVTVFAAKITPNHFGDRSRTCVANSGIPDIVAP